MQNTYKYGCVCLTMTTAVRWLYFPHPRRETKGESLLFSPWFVLLYFHLWLWFPSTNVIRWRTLLATCVGVEPLCWRSRSWQASLSLSLGLPDGPSIGHPCSCRTGTPDNALKWRDEMVMSFVKTLDYARKMLRSWWNVAQCRLWITLKNDQISDTCIFFECP